MTFFKRLDFLVFHLAAHGPEVGRALGQCRRRGGRTGGLDLDVDVGILALVLLGPQGHEIGQGIRTDSGQVPGNATGALIIRQSRVDPGFCMGDTVYSDSNRQRCASRNTSQQIHWLIS